MNKKLISILLAIMLMLSAMPFAFASDAEPTMTISSATAALGESVTLTVSMQNNPGFNTFSLSFNYDPSCLNLKSVTKADAFPGSFAYSKRAVWQNTEDTDYNGEIMTLTFDVLSDATVGDTNVALAYESGDICNYDEDDVDFALNPGTISIYCKHTNVETIAGKEASCNETGLTEGKYCPDCKTWIVEQKTINKLEHNYVETANTATCTEGGEKTFTCSLCSDSYTEESEALGHDYVPSETTATCTEGGFTTYTCSRCGNSYSDEAGEPLGHSFTNYVPNGDATCLEDGTKTAKCDRCDVTDTIADKGSALGHSFTNYVSNNDATCTEDGTKTAKCDRCDVTETISDEGSALGHSFTNYVSNNDATCTEDGTKTAKCDRCDVTETISDEGSALGHTYGEWITDVEPSCTETGHRYRTCTIDEAVDEETIPPTGHVDEDKDNICDVCGTDLTPENTCEYCGQVHEGFFGKITYAFHKLFLRIKNFFGDYSVGHIHKYETVVTAPTCTGQGYTTHICKICGNTYVDDYTEPLGHDFSVWHTDIEATCESEGHQYSICSRCQERAEQTIPVSNIHTDADGDGVCDICGKGDVCKYCGKIHNDFLFGGVTKAIHNLLFSITNLFKK